MIHGQVTPQNEAVIQIQVAGPAGEKCCVEAVIDTGFSGYLSLSPSVVESLHLPFRHTETYTLADDLDVELSVYVAHITWDGRDRRVFIVSAGDTALLGMSAIRGHRLTIDALDGGGVTIERLN